jgi:hypothetical protein
MASEFQRAAWRELRAAGKTIVECKQMLMFTLEEVQDCEHMRFVHERKVW